MLHIGNNATTPAVPGLRWKLFMKRIRGNCYNFQSLRYLTIENGLLMDEFPSSRTRR